jgi:hypothetical protein
MGVKEVVVFHSSKEIIAENQGSVEWTKGFVFIADPKRELYKIVGAELSGWKYVFRLNFATIRAAMKGLGDLFKRKHWGAEEGVTQRPVDILIDASTGTIIDLKYGINPGDLWSVADLIIKYKLALKIE